MKKLHSCACLSLSKLKKMEDLENEPRESRARPWGSLILLNASFFLLILFLFQEANIYGKAGLNTITIYWA